MGLSGLSGRLHHMEVVLSMLLRVQQRKLTFLSMKERDAENNIVIPLHFHVFQQLNERHKDRLAAGGLSTSLASTARHVLRCLAGSTGSGPFSSLLSLGLLGTFLNLAKGSLTGCFTLLWLLGLLLGNHLHGGPAHSAGSHPGGSPALLASYLLLLVLAVLLTVQHGPCELCRALALVEHSLALLLQEQKLLAIYANKQHSLSWVNF